MYICRNKFKHMENREIKFRAWHKLNEVMIENASIYDDFIQMIHTKKDTYDVMQYTGVKDKNGKEIYEGDIITCEVYEREEYSEFESDIPLVVSFSNGGFYPFTKASQWRSSVENVEVIGNIHENKDLI